MEAEVVSEMVEAEVEVEADVQPRKGLDDLPIPTITFEVLLLTNPLTGQSIRIPLVEPMICSSRVEDEE